VPRERHRIRRPTARGNGIETGALGYPSPASYLLHLGVASDIGLSVEQVQGVLITIAPVIGSARVASAGSSIAQGLGLATAIADE
jgi:hypothetical protein